MELELVKPYLIQRGRVTAPLAPTDTRLSNAVNFDYMGSSEFEYGALPSSFRQLQTMRKDWQLRLVPHMTEHDVPLRVFSALTDEQFIQYVAYLEELRKPPNLCKIHTKESVRFSASLSSESSRRDPDFWWDINNHVMFGFNKNFMNRLESYVSASLAYMDEQKAKGDGA